MVSGALHPAAVAVDWPVEKVLRGMFKLLKDAPDRQAEYMRGSVNWIVSRKILCDPVGGKRTSC